MRRTEDNVPIRQYANVLIQFKIWEIKGVPLTGALQLGLLKGNGRDIDKIQVAADLGVIPCRLQKM